MAGYTGNLNPLKLKYVKKKNLPDDVDSVSMEKIPSRSGT